MKKMKKTSILGSLMLLITAMCSNVAFATGEAGNQNNETTVLLYIYIGLIAASVIIVAGISVYYVKNKKPYQD